MAARKKKGLSIYVLPILFGGVLLALGLLQNKTAEPIPAREIQAGEPLTLTDMAIENYLYSDGYALDGDRVLDADGREAARLTVSRGDGDRIDGLTLTFSLPTYVQTKNSAVLTSLKAEHDAAAQRGETLFLALFDAIAATDGHIPARRDSALTKLRTAMDAGKSATQSANSWRFTFSLTPGELQGTVTIQFIRVK